MIEDIRYNDINGRPYIVYTIDLHIWWLTYRKWNIVKGNTSNESESRQ
jgi:hypothetical protein